jgi:hypothetical protein
VLLSINNVHRGHMRAGRADKTGDDIEYATFCRHSGRQAIAASTPSAAAGHHHASGHRRDLGWVKAKISERTVVVRSNLPEEEAPHDLMILS